MCGLQTLAGAGGVFRALLGATCWEVRCVLVVVLVSLYAAHSSAIRKSDIRVGSHTGAITLYSGHSLGIWKSTLVLSLCSGESFGNLEVDAGDITVFRGLLGNLEVDAGVITVLRALLGNLEVLCVLLVAMLTLSLYRGRCCDFEEVRYGALI